MKSTAIYSFVAGAVLLWAAPTLVSQQGKPCENTARAQLEAATFEAHAQFWLDVANCIENRDGYLPDCIREAFVAREEALEEAEEQYEERLDVCEDLGSAAYDPDIDPMEFSSNVDNPYWPLVVGRTLVYEKQTPEGLERIEVTALNETVEIDGYECRSVQDLVFLDGDLIEDTIDWYAQRCDGDVWYFGEIALNYEDGFLNDIDGSWRTGTDDAEPGILMKANPQIGDIYRQEYFLNEAEDMGEVVALNQTVTVPAGTFTGCVQTEDWTPIEPGVTEWKFYAPGIGMILELDPETGERLELIEIR